MKHTKLREGDTAPGFNTIDSLGEAVDLASYSDRFVLLAFLRYSGCPWCNLTIHRLSLEYKMLAENGCEVIAFVQSPAENIVRHIYGRHKVRPPYPIIADPERKLYKQYGVGTSVKAAARSLIEVPYWLKSVYEFGFRQSVVDGNLLLVPAMFLIGPGDQKIVHASYGSSFYDHKTFTDIYEPLIFK